MSGTRASRFRRLPDVDSGILAIALVGSLGALGYLVFPNDLAFFTRAVAIVLLVLSLDLVTGYCGVVTLSQAALFGTSAYVVGNACILGLREPVTLLLVGVAAGAASGAMAGALITRFSGLPQLIISIAFGGLVGALANKISWFTGGSDGLNGITPGPVLGIFRFDLLSRTSFGFSLAVLALVLIVLLRFVRSPFGLTCRAIKDDPLRARAIGAAVFPRLVTMYAVSGGVGGIGGALMAINTGVVGLDSVSVDRSAEALVMLALGGTGNLWGAVFGAVLFQTFEHVVGVANPFQWMTIVGAVLIALVLFAPHGLSHRVVELWRNRSLEGPA